MNSSELTITPQELADRAQKHREMEQRRKESEVLALKEEERKRENEQRIAKLNADRIAVPINEINSIIAGRYSYARVSGSEGRFADGSSTKRFSLTRNGRFEYDKASGSLLAMAEGVWEWAQLIPITEITEIEIRAHIEENPFKGSGLIVESGVGASLPPKMPAQVRVVTVNIRSNSNSVKAKQKGMNNPIQRSNLVVEFYDITEAGTARLSASFKKLVAEVNVP